MAKKKKANLKIKAKKGQSKIKTTQLKVKTKQAVPKQKKKIAKPKPKASTPPIYFKKTFARKNIKPQSDFCKFDLHIHSKYSSDAVIEPETIIKRAKATGLKGFAITDHNTIRAWPELTRLAKQNNLIFIPGQEIDVTFNGNKLGHLLALFTYDKISSTEILDVIEDARSQSALLSFPHPFDTGRYFKGFDYLINNGPISRFVPAIETFNSRVLTSRANDIAKDFAHKHGLLQTAGSDAHMPYEIGRGYIIAKAQTELELLREIKLGRVVVNGELSGLAPRIHTLGAYMGLLRDRHFR